MTANGIEKEHAPLLRFFSRLLSWIFHPLFIGVIMMAYLSFINPTIFLAVSKKSALLKFITFVNNNVVFPALIVFLLRGLGFSQSIQLRTQKERIIPYIASIIFFFWTWYVFKHQPDSPQVLTDMCQGIFFSSTLALILNNFSKISMHAIGMGGLLGLMTVVILSGHADGLLFPALSILLTGAVLTARLVVTDHSISDIVIGLLLGFAMQLFAWWL